MRVVPSFFLIASTRFLKACWSQFCATAAPASSMHTAASAPPAIAKYRFESVMFSSCRLRSRRAARSFVDRLDDVALFLRVLVDDLHDVTFLDREHLLFQLAGHHEGIGLSGLRIGDLRAALVRAFEQQVGVLRIDPHHLAARFIRERDPGDRCKHERSGWRKTREQAIVCHGVPPLGWMTAFFRWGRFVTHAEGRSGHTSTLAWTEPIAARMAASRL